MPAKVYIALERHASWAWRRSRSEGAFCQNIGRDVPAALRVKSFKAAATLVAELRYPFPDLYASARQPPLGTMHTGRSGAPAPHSSATGGSLAAAGTSAARCGTIGSMSDLITKLVPILHVEDPDAERRFYEQLGLRTTYEGPEYPGFIAVGNDAVEFGLSRRPGADPAASSLTWQLGVSDVDVAVAVCERSGGWC